ncbi:MAG: hypothetical protein ACYDD1_12145 [Caulobacteraceae bacterium]
MTQLFRHELSSGGASAPLRVIVVVLASANVAFLMGMLTSPWLGGGACILMAISLLALFGRTDQVPQAEPRSDQALMWALAIMVALLLCLLGGEGRIFYANTDWQIRDAVLADLVRRPWPVSYVLAGGGELVLRAPLGMFMLPSLVGRMLGWRAAAPALLAQNTVLLAAILTLFMSGSKRWFERILIVVVFVGFSGLDIVGQLLIGHFASPSYEISPVPSLETWAFGLQYSSIVTDLFWAPNHGLPALAMAAGYVAWRRGQASSLTLAAVTGLSMLWSPLAVMGAAPFAILAGLQDLKAGRIGWLSPTVLTPLAVALLPVAVYLTLKGGTVEHGLNIDRLVLKLYSVFFTLEIAPLLYLASRAPSLTKTRDRTDLYACTIILTFIPFYYIGGSNDFMMRSSIFPIALLAIMTARGLMLDLDARRTGRVLFSLALLVAGAATPMFEISRAIRQPVNPPVPTDLIAAWEAPASAGASKAAYAIPLRDFKARSWLFKQP